MPSGFETRDKRRDIPVNCNVADKPCSRATWTYPSHMAGSPGIGMGSNATSEYSNGGDSLRSSTVTMSDDILRMVGYMSDRRELVVVEGRSLSTDEGHSVGSTVRED